MAPAPWFPPSPPVTSGFWNATNVQGLLKEFRNTLDLSEAMEKELETLIAMKGIVQHIEGTYDRANETATRRVSKFLENIRISLDT
ncbi:hypothetical protein HanIR_Chr08g0359811 [Helianthus annuus]|nr:hypothetical protein HanIR_Chr08g0359811 [Helianthus annuus]